MRSCWCPVRSFASLCQRSLTAFRCSSRRTGASAGNNLSEEFNSAVTSCMAGCGRGGCTRRSVRWAVSPGARLGRVRRVACQGDGNDRFGVTVAPAVCSLVLPVGLALDDVFLGSRLQSVHRRSRWGSPLRSRSRWFRWPPAGAAPGRQPQSHRPSGFRCTRTPRDEDAAVPIGTCPSCHPHREQSPGAPRRSHST